MTETHAEPRFDDSLTRFVEILRPILGAELLENGLILRDASGRLALIAEQPIPADQQARAVAALQDQLPRYTRGERSLLYAEQPGVSAIRPSVPHWHETLSLAGGAAIRVAVGEHRIIGQDWLNEPFKGWQPSEPMRLVFASLKGGVGRSTALAITATELARRGYKVLVLDLDLEAPGIGFMLLAEDELPAHGLLDLYVEAGVGGYDRALRLDSLSPSRFARGQGLIDVVPAVGRATLARPGDFLAKIARAYLDHPNGPNGEHSGFLQQTRRLVKDLAQEKAYDAILIDARAGLNETTAASLLGLGADVLLFGDDRPQTFAGLRFLLAHLARFPRLEQDDWLLRFRLIHAMSPADASAQEAYRDRAFDLFRDALYRQQPLVFDACEIPVTDDSSELTLDEFSADDQQAPHYAWPVLRDAHYHSTDPLSQPNLLEPEFYLNSYRALIDGIIAILAMRTDASANL